MFWGIDHPLNTANNQSGQAHTSPGAEFVAIVIAIEQARWPIHIYSDNLGFVIATQKLLAGESTNLLKENFDLWARVKRRLNAKQKHIRITWIKGHATEADIKKGNSSIAHQKGNNEADTLENAGSKIIALPDLLFQGHLLKKKIVVAIQAMFLACYNRRQEKRQALALETAVERELEGPTHCMGAKYSRQ